jgi:hypothetical protein
MAEERMADELSRMWGSFSLSEMEGDEMEIQNHAWEVGARRGKTCLVGKLIADHLVSKEVIRTTLLRGWKPSETPTFKVLGDNLFLVDFVEESDKIRVLEGRPWVFEGNLFAVEDYDGLTKPSDFSFDKATFWVRMIGLPLACMNLTVGHQIGTSMGQVEEVDVDDGGMGWGEYLRVKITLDLQKPLMRGRMLKINGSSMLVKFQYERLPKFCFRCGVIKHGITGCSEKREARKQHAPTEYGMWLRASSPKRSFGGKAGQEAERRDNYQREKMAGFGRYDQGRRNSPSRRRPPHHGGEGGGKRPGKSADEDEPVMERSKKSLNFPSEDRSAEEIVGVMGAFSNSKDRNSGEENRDVVREKISEAFNGIFKAHVVENNAAGNGKNEERDCVVENNAAGNGKNEERDCVAENGKKRSQVGLANVNDLLDELANKSKQQAEKMKEVVLEENINEEGWRRGAKRSRGSGNNFFTLSEVEQKMQRALSNETGSGRRASDDTWRKKDTTKSTKTNSGDGRGKRKLSEPNDRGEEALKKNSMKGGRMMKQIGMVTKNDKNGSGMAEAGNQPRRPQ